MTVPEVSAVNPKDGPRHLAAPRAHQACERDDLAPGSLRLDVVEDLVPGEVVDLEDDLARVRPGLGVQAPLRSRPIIDRMMVVYIQVAGEVFVRVRTRPSRKNFFFFFFFFF